MTPARSASLRVPTKTRVVLVVKGDAEIVKMDSEGVLIAGIGFAILVADVSIFFKGDIVFLHVGKAIFDGGPATREWGAQVFKAIGFSIDGGLELVDTNVSFAVSMNKSFDVGILFQKGTTVDIKGLFLDFIENNEDGRVSAKALDQFQPVFGVAVFMALTTIENEDVEAASSKEKLVSRVHNFLSTKVPDMEGDLFWMVIFFLKLNRPLGNLDALGFMAVGDKSLVNKTID